MVESIKMVKVGSRAINIHYVTHIRWHWEKRAFWGYNGAGNINGNGVPFHFRKLQIYVAGKYTIGVDTRKDASALLHALGCDNPRDWRRRTKEYFCPSEMKFRDMEKGYHRDAYAVLVKEAKKDGTLGR